MHPGAFGGVSSNMTGFFLEAGMIQILQVASNIFQIFIPWENDPIGLLQILAWKPETTN